MNKVVLHNAGIDIKNGLERFNNNEALYKKWLRNFINDELFSKMLDAIDQKNAYLAFSFAHSLKGMTGNLSFTKLYKDLYPLVEILREGSVSNLDSYLLSIKEDYELIIKTLKEIDLD